VPLHATLQMRPTLAHVDDAEAKKKSFVVDDDEEEEAGPAPVAAAPALQPLQVRFRLTELSVFFSRSYTRALTHSLTCSLCSLRPVFVMYGTGDISPSRHDRRDSKTWPAIEG